MSMQVTFSQSFKGTGSTEISRDQNAIWEAGFIAPPASGMSSSRWCPRWSSLLVKLVYDSNNEVWWLFWCLHTYMYIYICIYILNMCMYIHLICVNGIKWLIDNANSVKKKHEPLGGTTFYCPVPSSSQVGMIPIESPIGCPPMLTPD